MLRSRHELAQKPRIPCHGLGGRNFEESDTKNDIEVLAYTNTDICVDLISLVSLPRAARSRTLVVLDKGHDAM